MSYFRLCWVYLRVAVMNELQYRVNFFVQLFQSFLALGTGLVMLALVFSYTDSLGGWGRYELLAVMGVYILVGGLIAITIRPNMERLMDDVQEGTLDYMLTKPEDAQLLVSVREVRIWQIVDVVIGLVVLGLAVSQLQGTIGFLHGLAFGTTLLGGDRSGPFLVDDAVSCMGDTAIDGDGDGCSWYEEGFGSPSPKPGSTCTAVQPCYNDSVAYDFYDVPVPVNTDPVANGPRNAAVTMSDVLAVLRYVGTKDGGLPNPNGVDYDSVKGSCDWNADTTPDKEGLCYDRSSGPAPNPPWEAGPPDGAISMQDIMVVLPQMGLNCSGPP